MRKADNLPPSCAVVTKSGKLNFLEPSGPVEACNGTALPSTDNPLPLVIDGDEGSLKGHQRWPYLRISNRNDDSKQIYYHRLLRANRIVQNAFRILSHERVNFTAEFIWVLKREIKQVWLSCKLYRR